MTVQILCKNQPEMEEDQSGEQQQQTRALLASILLLHRERAEMSFPSK